MRNSAGPNYLDWLAATLGWLVLFGLTMNLAWTSTLSVWAGLVILLCAALNLAFFLFTAFSPRFPYRRAINLSANGLAALALFWLTLGVSGAPVLSSVLFILLAGVYFSLKGALAAWLALTLAQAGLIFVFSTNTDPLLLWGGIAALNLLLALGLGWACRILHQKIRALMLGQRQTRQEVDQHTRKREHDRVQAFYELATTLSATLNYQAVLNSVLDLGSRVLEEDPELAAQMISAVFLFEGNELKIGPARGLGPADLRSRLPGRQGILLDAIQNAEPQVCSAPVNDPELGMITALHSCRSAVVLALRSGMDVYGALLFAHSRTDYFNPERCETLDAISRQSVIAIRNAMLYQDLREEKERLIETQEEARKKLARDLHDGPTQSLAAITMRVNFARKLLERDVKATAEELVKIEEMARRTTKEIRHMLFTLRPLVLENQGLKAALEAMAEKMRETYSQNVLIDVQQGIIDQLELGRQTVVFYIIEEAITNARKHAQASHIWVRIKPVPRQPDIAWLEIQDDGVGFDVETVNSTYDTRGSLGMVNLRERSELINGLLNIQSTPGQGSRFQVFIPLTEEAADRLHRPR